LRFVLEPLAAKEPQVYGFFGISVSQALDQLADRDFDPEFLSQFTGQALLERLVRFAFASGEFPKTAQMSFGVALRNEEASIPKHEPGGDIDGRAVGRVDTRGVQRPMLL
jgi:hypothetical protein